MKKFLTLIAFLVSVPVHAEVTITVDIDRQQMTVTDGNSVKLQTRVSTGREGFETPDGNFRILGKEEKHTSNIYDASMPYMQRLTYSGIAIHAGNVSKGYASHGCIRVPLEVAKKLFTMTDIGTRVRIIKQTSSFEQAFANM